MNWAHGHWRRCLLAASASFALNALLLASFVGGAVREALPERRAFVTRIVFAHSPQSTPPPLRREARKPTQRTNQSQADRSPPRSQREGEPLHTSPLATPSLPSRPTDSPTGVHVPEPPDPSASTPLRIDTDTIRTAIARSKGALQQAAESSGASMRTQAVSVGEALGSRVAATAKADCAASNSHGSLLSLPLLAFAAIAGQCK